MNRTSVSYKLAGRLRDAVRYFLVICIAVGLCSVTDIRAVSPPVANKTIIVVDPGHGGVDGGTSGGNLLEKDVNLAISMKLKALLEQKGYTAVLTREADVSLDGLNQSSPSRHLRDLNARVGIINSSGARLFLSVHVNSMVADPSQSGSLVFYSRESRESRMLAYFIQDALNRAKAEGVVRRKNDPLPGRYYLLVGTLVPGVIIETAYITNPAELALLATESFQQQLAEAIAAGADAFLRSESEPQ